MKDVQKIAIERQKINDGIRSFFRNRGYVEVETPLVVESPGMEPNLAPFETTVREPNGVEYKAGLITSPEYSMKKLLGQGMQKIFTLTKVFRNEESLGGNHNPEFTMLEWYQQGADYHVCMDETQALIESFGFSEKIEHATVRELFLDHIGIDLNNTDVEALKKACQELGIHTDQSDTESDLFYRLFLERVEPTFVGRNLFVYDYPKHQAALSMLTPDKKFGQRFELYLNGLELCNGFTELTDATEQRERFLEEAGERKGLGKPVYPIDEELLRLLPSLHVPTFGNALGVDRLHMSLFGQKNIEDVLLFPASDLFTTSQSKDEY